MIRRGEKRIKDERNWTDTAHEDFEAGLWLPDIQSKPRQLGVWIIAAG